MKIALPSHNGNIDDHFGHCEYFTIITIDDKNKICSEERIDSSVACGCKSGIVDTLAAQGVSLMLAGNIGGGAINVLQNHGIQVIRGCSGGIHAVVQQWLNGAVTDTGIACQAHDHSSECHN